MGTDRAGAQETQKMCNSCWGPSAWPCLYLGLGYLCSQDSYSSLRAQAKCHLFSKAVLTPIGRTLSPWTGSWAPVDLSPRGGRASVTSTFVLLVPSTPWASHREFSRSTH